MPSKDLEIKYYDGIAARDIKWLWYPYIAYGKVTMIQGDPGDGKTTFVMNVASHLTKGLPLPNGEQTQEPVTVLFQNDEDGKEDTIKPKLESMGADCSRVAYLEYFKKAITFDDDRIEEAIINTGAKMTVFDPIQAFLGKIDMNRANDVRPLMKRLAVIAEKTGCAIILVGHMNKSSGGKGIYRSLGSIDFPAAARSSLLVGKVGDNENIRAIAHIKTNLGKLGKPIALERTESGAFRWIDDYEINAAELLGDAEPADDGKIGAAIKLLIEMLQDGQRLAVELMEECNRAGISARTVHSAKTILSIKSVKSQGKWYWAAADSEV